MRQMTFRALRGVSAVTLVMALGACTGLNMRLGESGSPSGVDVTIIPLDRNAVSQDLSVTGNLAVGRPLSELRASLSEYEIGPGDVLDIRIPNLVLSSTGGQTSQALGIGVNDQGYTVASDGTVFVPFAGVLKAGGKTLREFQAEVSAGLRKFLRTPQVIVSIRAFRSQRVLIAGHVPRPGYQFLTDVPVTVVGGLSAAGAAITAEQGSGVRLAATRNTSQRQTLDGDYTRVTLSRQGRQYQLDLANMLQKGDLSRDVPLRNGDVVYVPPIQRDYAFVLGQVRQQALMQITIDRTSLAEVLTAAGGLDQSSANGERVYVIRGGLERPVVYQLNADRADAFLLADAFTVQPRDVIYVAEAGISRWNRFLRQLLPTVQTLLTGAIVADRVDSIQED